MASSTPEFAAVGLCLLALPFVIGYQMIFGETKEKIVNPKLEAKNRTEQKPSTTSVIAYKVTKAVKKPLKEVAIGVAAGLMPEKEKGKK